MSKNTKKVGTSGRYGVRYGTKTKKAVAEIESRIKKENVCPYCEKQKLKKIAAGIWYCK